MDELSKCLQILGLKPDYSEAELEDAFQERADAWDPERFAHNPQLRSDAEEKLRHIHAAHEFLRAKMSANALPSATQSDTQFKSSPGPVSTEAAVLAGKRAAFWATLAALILFLLGAACLVFWEQHATQENATAPGSTNAVPP